jgi:hypothetical protein
LLILIPFIPLLVKIFERCILKVKLPASDFLSNELAKERMISYADGVFSFAITLIVLDIDTLTSVRDGATISDRKGRPLPISLAHALYANWNQCVQTCCFVSPVPTHAFVDMLLGSCRLW